MNVKEAYVTRENPAEIFSIIEDQLFSTPDTQIFVSNEIYQDLRRYGEKYHVYTADLTRTSHYNVDGELGGEEWLILTEGTYFDKLIARASFISNCRGYKQLVEFHSFKVCEYIHYMMRFKALLLIQFEETKC